MPCFGVPPEVLLALILEEALDGAGEGKAEAGVWRVDGGVEGAAPREPGEAMSISLTGISLPRSLLIEF